MKVNACGHESQYFYHLLLNQCSAYQVYLASHLSCPLREDSLPNSGKILCSYIWNIAHAWGCYLQLSHYMFYFTPDMPIKITILDALYTILLHLVNIVSLCLCSVLGENQISEITDKLELITNTFIRSVRKNITYFCHCSKQPCWYNIL